MSWENLTEEDQRWSLHCCCVAAAAVVAEGEQEEVHFVAESVDDIIKMKNDGPLELTALRITYTYIIRGCSVKMAKVRQERGGRNRVRLK